MTASSLNIRSGPGAGNPTVGAPLGKGMVVQSLGTQDGWTHVIVQGSGVTGWVSSQFLETAVAAHA